MLQGKTSSTYSVVNSSGAIAIVVIEECVPNNSSAVMIVVVLIGVGEKTPVVDA